MFSRALGLLITLFFPISALAEDTKGPTQLRVISYNVQFLPGVGAFFNKRSASHYRAKAIGRALAEYDIIGLNEVFDDNAKRILLEELHNTPDRTLHVVETPAKNKSRFGIDSGLLILSRFPVVERHALRYGNDSTPEKFGLGADGFAAKGALHARLDCGKVDGTKRVVDVFVTHLESRDQSIRDQQYKLFGEFVAKRAGEKNSILLLGDFNTAGNDADRKDRKSSYHRLLGELRRAGSTKTLVDVWPSLSKKPGGTSDQRGKDGGRRIDYVFLLNPTRGLSLQPKSVCVRRFADEKVEFLSDHSAVSARFEWK